MNASLPAAVPAIPDEAAEAVCRDMAVARGATNAALPEVPAAPESAPASVRVVRVPTLDRDAQEDAMAAGALSGGVVGFLIGLQRSKKDQGG
jgi:hypothetical protein